MAINTVMKHYEGYIAKLATRKMYDEYGNVHYCVDKTLRDRLEAKLLKTILEFKNSTLRMTGNQYPFLLASDRRHLTYKS